VRELGDCLSRILAALELGAPDRESGSEDLGALLLEHVHQSRLHLSSILSTLPVLHKSLECGTANLRVVKRLNILRLPLLERIKDKSFHRLNSSPNRVKLLGLAAKLAHPVIGRGVLNERVEVLQVQFVLLELSSFVSVFQVLLGSLAPLHHVVEVEGK
jgi:hypothetical protein